MAWILFHQAREAKLEYAMSNSFGFGGTHGALLFRRWSERALPLYHPPVQPR
jgi:hypothetical protein